MIHILVSAWHFFSAGSGLQPSQRQRGNALDMPESILVRFKGKMQPGITLEILYAIPYYGIKQGLLTVEKAGKINEFSGRVLEIEGVEHLTVEQAFELSDASAGALLLEYCQNSSSIEEYLNSNIVMLKWMISEGYGDRRTIERRIAAMEEWLANPELMEADADAEYAHVIDIDLAEIQSRSFAHQMIRRCTLAI